MSNFISDFAIEMAPKATRLLPGNASCSQERRASARRGANSRLQRLPLLWTNYVSPRTFASHTTAGSRQPLLLQGASRLRNNDIRGAQTHVSKSGGRQPAVVRITHGVRGGSHNVRQLSSPQSRAAGVSRPWRGHTIARGECCSARSEQTTKSGGCQPAGFICASNARCAAMMLRRSVAKDLPRPRLGYSWPDGEPLSPVSAGTSSRFCCCGRLKS